MKKTLLQFLLVCLTTYLALGQPCAITSVNATPLACNGNNFLVSINIEVENPASPGFTLAGNGVIYGTYLYEDLPIVVGPLLGDDESVYEFIAWDVDDANCQNYTTLPAANCGPICHLSNAELNLVTCLSPISALVDFDFDHVNTSSPTFTLHYENGEQVGNSNGVFLYSSLPITINAFQVSGAAPIILTVCDNTNNGCCETFTLPAIDCNANNCEIFSMTVDPECTGNNFLVHLDFDFDNPASDSFHLDGNNLVYGNFAYADLPITVGPLNGNTNINWQFVVSDTENPACSETYALGVYHCPPPCAIDSLGADAFLCNGDEFYMLELGLAIEGQGTTGFSVFSENHFYGSHGYGELPLIIENFEGSGQFVDQVTVCDNAHPTCCATTPYEALLCAGCIIYNLTATPQPCNDDDQFYVQIDFDHQNNSDAFEVTGNGNSYGLFEYTEVPVLVGPFDGDGSTFLEFVITDANDEFCFAATEIGSINCNEICELSNLTVTTGDCSGSDTYVAQIDFDFQGVSGIGFDLSINGEFYHFYSYDELPLTIEDFPSNGSGHDLVTVCENDNSQCCTSLLFASPDCACDVYETTAEVLDCTSDSTYAISLEFFTLNTPNNNVDIYIDGVYWGFYNGNNLPIIIDDVPEGDGTTLVTICASDQNDCCDNVVIENMNCEAAVCNIFELFAEPGDCNSDSTYLLDFSFETMHLGSDSITVTANGEFIGEFPIMPDFNRIEHFPVLSSTTVHLVVCSFSEPDCCDDYTFTAPDCSLFGHCNIDDLQAIIGDCQSDSTYVLHIEFNPVNLPTDSVHISANGDDYGNFVVNNGSIFLENFPVYPGEFTTIMICAQGDDECCAALDFETPGCPSGPACHIDDVHVIIGDCTSDSTYVAHVEFNYENLGSDSVVVTVNGNVIAHHAVNDGSFALEQFPIVDANHTVITICSLGNDDCCDSFEYETPDCEGGGTCHLFDLVADPGDCLTDSTYTLFIHYYQNNSPSDSVIVFANDTYIGTYLHNTEGITISPFPVFETDFTHITVCTSGAQDCCDDFNFVTPDCGQGSDCNIDDLIAIIGDCQTDSTYILHIEFNFAHLPTDSVHITANDHDLGNYQVHEGTIFLENFPVYETIFTVLRVCAVGNEDCCAIIEFETPNCEGGGTCHLFDLVADPGDCLSDSSFNLFIHYFSNNFPGDSIVVTANDSLIGHFLHQPDGFTIENFPRFPGEVTHITVCALSAPDCCDDFNFETPFCTDECAIYNITVQPFFCNSDSTFSAVLHFDYQNIDAGGFDVYAGDKYLGFFPFSELPIAILNFPSNETGNYQVTICESDNTECCTTQEFNGPTCGEEACHIYDLTWSTTDCDSAGLFYFVLDFEFDHVGDDGFNIHGNGNNYGNFNYDNLPVILGPFESNETNWEFIVNDGAHPDCFDVINPGDVECGVATEPVNPEAYFAIFNNGSQPGILARKNVEIAVFNGDGKNVITHLQVPQDNYYSFDHLADGFYILMVKHGQNTWPVKLIRTGN